MIFYALLFLSFLVIFSAASFCPPRIASKVQNISCWILIIVSILRFDVGWDFPSYYFLEVPEISALSDFFTILFEKQYDIDYDSFYKFELIPRILWLAAKYIDCPALPIIICSFFTYILVFKTIREWSKAFTMSFLLYLAFAYWDTLGLVRHTLAISIVFFSTRYIIKKDFCKFALCICIASLCHKSAIALLFLYPIYYWIPLSYVLFGCCGLLFFGVFLRDHLLNMLGYGAYVLVLEHDLLSGGGIILFLNIAICIFSGMLLFFTPKEQRGINQNLFKFLLIGSTTPFIFGATIGGRIALYFNIFQILIIPNLLSVLFPKNKVIHVSFCVAVSAFALAYLYFTTLNTRKSPFTPYRCVLFTDTTLIKEDTEEFIHPK